MRTWTHLLQTRHRTISRDTEQLKDLQGGPPGWRGLGPAGRQRSSVGTPPFTWPRTWTFVLQTKVSPSPPPHAASPCKYRLPGTNKAFCGDASPSASASALSRLYVEICVTVDRIINTSLILF